MASQLCQRVRLVKCPKCLKILQEDEDVPVYQCGGCSTVLQAKKRNIAPKSTPSVEETESSQASESRTNNVDTVLSSSAERSPVQEKDQSGSINAQEKQLGDSRISNENETNEIQEESDSEEIEEEDNVSTSLRQDTALSSSAECSPVQEYEMDRSGSMESLDKHLGDLEISNGDDTNEIQEDNSRLKSVMAEAPGSGASSGSLSADHVVAAGASNSSGNVEISPEASPVEDTQNQTNSPANKTSSAYDGSESSSDYKEDQPFDETEQWNALHQPFDETEQWNALQKIRSEKFETQRYPGYKEQGSSSSSAFFENRRNGTTTTYPNRSLQLDGPGGRLGRQGRRHVSEQLRPDVPFYPREQYTRVSPSYLSHDEFDRYSRAQSFQMPPYNQEYVDYMYHNNIRARGRGQGTRLPRIPFSEEIRNNAGQLHYAYSSYSASPQRLMEQQPEYYPRYSREIASDVEDHHQRSRHPGHHRREFQRQRVAKRHVRPTAGGAPFVSCYRCSQSLQLPVDFLIFKRKHHLLRCGTCTTVLRFSLQSRTHLVPAITHDIEANRSSNSTSESPRDKAEKRSSSVQDEDLPVSRGSPLHRLMGYSTVSQVFKPSKRPPSF